MFVNLLRMCSTFNQKTFEILVCTYTFQSVRRRLHRIWLKISLKTTHSLLGLDFVTNVLRISLDFPLTKKYYCISHKTPKYFSVCSFPNFRSLASRCKPMCHFHCRNVPLLSADTENCFFPPTEPNRVADLSKSCLPIDQSNFYSKTSS